MVYTSKYADIDLFESGIIQFLFSNRTHYCPEDRPIFVDAIDGRTITFAQLKDYVLRFAAGLQDVCDFKEDDVIALFAPNNYDYLVPVLGALAANGSVSTANPNYNVEELVHQLELSKAKIVICHRSNSKIALAAAESVGIPKKNIFIFGRDPIDGILPFKIALYGSRKANPRVLNKEEAKDKVAYLCFSSGTTGKSKGVMTTHANMTANIAQYAVLDEPFLDFKKDSMLAVLPFFHIFGLSSILHLAVYWGMTVYVLPRFHLQTFCELVQKYKIAYIPLAPPIFLQLAKEDIVTKYDLSSFKYGFSAAAPLSANVTKACKKRLPNLTIKQGYGMTETSPAVIMGYYGDIIDGSVGHLLPNVLAKIVDENGNEVAHGEPGELWFKGPNIMKGYISNPEATAEAIDKDGYYHSGDVGIATVNGHFFIVDRIKELIKYNGFQVPPAELEGILLKSPIIADCAVVGIYDSSRASELPCACVVLKSEYEPSEKVTEEIMKFVADQVISYKQIRVVRYMESIPKNPSGKILRRVLRDMLKKDANESVKSRL